MSTGLSPASKAAVLAARDARPALLQQRALDALEYGDKTEAHTLRPDLEAGLILAVTNPSEIPAWEAAHPAVKARYGSQITNAAITADRQTREFYDRLKTSDNQRTTSTKNAESTATQAAASLRQAAASEARTRIEQEGLNLRTDDVLAKRQQALRAERNQAGATMATPAGMQYIEDELKKVTPDPAHLQRLMERVGIFAANPEFKDASPSDVVQALAGNGSIWTTNMGAVSRLRDIMASHPDEAVRRQSHVTELQTHLDAAQRLRDALNSGNGGAASPTPAPSPSPSPVPAVNPAPEPASVAAPAGSPLDAKTAKLEAQYVKETGEITRFNGGRSQYSPEVQQYISERAALRDAEKLRATTRTNSAASASVATRYNENIQKIRALSSSPFMTAGVKPASVSVSSDVAISSGPQGVVATESTTPTTVPKDVNWGKPATLVEAKPSAQIKGTGQRAVVTYVGDGDGANLRTPAGNNINCRIDSIDAPETAKSQHNKRGQPYGEESKKTLQDMILNKEVTVRITKPSENGSNHGRALCQIEIQGKDVSHEMVKAGAAWVYQQYVKNPAEFNALEANARKNKLGLWDMPGTPQNPADFRHGANYFDK